MAARQTPTHSAEEGLLYARALAPFDPALGITAASIYLRRDKPEEARRVLAPVAFDPHGGAAAKEAQDALAALDAGNIKGALERLAADATKKTPAGS